MIYNLFALSKTLVGNNTKYIDGTMLIRNKYGEDKYNNVTLVLYNKFTYKLMYVRF
jgi:hypothetical protein